MEKDLLLVLEDIRKKVNKFYDGRKRDSYNEQINGLKQRYSEIEIEERHEETYNSLVNKGKELLKENNIKDEKKVSYYLRYCGAATYDFKNNMKPLNLIMKSFLLTCMLFFILGPQYLGFLLPLVFVVPIFMGLRGMRKRVLNGLMMGVSIVPMGVLVAIIWLRNAYLAMGNFGGFIAGIAKQFNLPMDFTQNLVIAFVIMSVVLLCSSFVLLYSAIKYRKMFI
jgi:phage shock protein PspC (stress-responsive transcriptional regulator)